MKSNSKNLVLKIVLGGVLLSAFVAACKSKDKTANPDQSAASGATLAEKTAELVPQVQESPFSGELVKRVPTDAFAVFQWEGANSAYKKLLSSPWADSGELSAMFKGNAPAIKEIEEFSVKLGIDINKPETWTTILSDVVLFVAPGKSPAAPLTYGILFKSDKSFIFKDKLNVIKTELEKSGSKFSSVDIPGATAYSIESSAQLSELGVSQLGAAGTTASNPQAGNGAAKSTSLRAIVAASEELNLLASDEETAKLLISTTSGTGPAFASEPKVKTAFKGVPEKANRFGVGFVDVQKGVSFLQKIFAGLPQAQALSAIPAVQGFAVSYAMEDAPRTDFRLLLDPAQKTGSIFGQLSSSDSKNLLNGVPKNSLLFLSLDGSTLKQLRDSAAKNMPAESQMLPSELAILDSVKRVGIAARIAPPGKSMLPIPDFMVAVEAANAENVAGQLRSLVGKKLSESGLATQTNWNAKQIGSASLYSLPAGFGFNAFSASTGGVAIISSSEDLLTNVMNSSGSKSNLVSGLAANSSQVLAGNNSIANLYLNFNELGTLLETMGGLLQMYAPQEPNTPNPLSPENLALIKKMGTMIASVEVDNEMLSLQYFYQPVS